MNTQGRQISDASEWSARRPDASRNLVIVHEPDIQDIADLESIAGEVEAAAPDIEVFVASNDIPSSTTRKQAARRPALIYSPTVLRRFQPARGKVYAGALIRKDVQARRLTDAGVSVPDFAILAGDFDLDPARFGPLVMVKPTGFTSHGRGIEIVRTSELAGQGWRGHAAVKRAGHRPIVQRFIDTGELPSHYRVLTFFGTPIFGFRAVSTVPRPALDSPPETLAAGPFMAKHGQRTLVAPVEADVLDLARKTFEAIPEVALHGCDLIRDKASGRLYVLEINPGGNTWSFSSTWADMLRRELRMQDLASQFDAWKTCARILIERTRAEAV